MAFDALLKQELATAIAIYEATATICDLSEALDGVRWDATGAMNSCSERVSQGTAAVPESGCTRSRMLRTCT